MCVGEEFGSINVLKHRKEKLELQDEKMELEAPDPRGIRRSPDLKIDFLKPITFSHLKQTNKQRTVCPQEWVWVSLAGPGPGSRAAGTGNLRSVT